MDEALHLNIALRLYNTTCSTEGEALIAIMHELDNAYIRGHAAGMDLNQGFVEELVDEGFSHGLAEGSDAEVRAPRKNAHAEGEEISREEHPELYEALSKQGFHTEHPLRLLLTAEDFREGRGRGQYE